MDIFIEYLCKCGRCDLCSIRIYYFIDIKRTLNVRRNDRVLERYNGVCTVGRRIQLPQKGLYFFVDRKGKCTRIL